MKIKIKPKQSPFPNKCKQQFTALVITLTFSTIIQLNESTPLIATASKTTDK